MRGGVLQVGAEPSGGKDFADDDFVDVAGDEEDDDDEPAKGARASKA